MNTANDVTGIVWGVFAHRFALETPDGKVLADLGPDAASSLLPQIGDRVTISGEKKPSEIKVSELVTPDGIRHRLARAKPHHAEKHGPADPEIALSAARGEGFVVTGEPTRKPKHWEVPATRNGLDHTLHIELDGRIRKIKDRQLQPAG